MLTPLIWSIGLILTAFVLLQQIALWQRKEYRWDRLRADLPASIAQVATGRIRRPQFTVKAWVILVAGSFLLGLVQWFFATYDVPEILRWLLIVLATPLVVPLAVGGANIAGSIQKERRQKQARAQRAQLSQLTVIGITGSYGKTSTKYFLHHILSGTDSEVKMSADRRNEAYVIAEDMLRQVTAKTATYVVEMGAYRQGEIRRIAEVVQPRIGVVTAISNQHVALFGSLAALADAKWELIESLPSDGIAVLNKDDATIVAKATGHRGRIVWYSLAGHADVWVEAIVHQPTISTCTLHVGDDVASVTVPLPGPGYISATVAAAAAAYAAGISARHIFDRIPSLPLVPQTMVVVKNSKGAIIIDDSYSANEQGVLMAIRHLQRFSQPKKLVVLRPLIELGSEAARVHQVIGQALAATGAEVLLYDMPGANEISHAATVAGAKHITRYASPQQLAAAVGQKVTADTVCLLENRLPAIVRDTALS